MDNIISQKCRSCLAQGCTLKPLSGFSKASENALHLSDVFMMCATIQIAPNDGFSQYACIHCINSAEKAYLFKKQCEHSDKIWNEFKRRLQKDSISNLVEVLPINDHAEIIVPISTPVKNECEADEYQVDNDPMTETGSVEIDYEMDNDLDIKSIEIHEEPKTENFTCKYCLTILVDEAKLLMHELAHTIEPKELAVKKYVIYDCQECSVDVKTAEEFIEHCHKLHENSIEKLYYRCKLCAGDFDHLSEFTAHVSNRHKTSHSPQLTNVSKNELECQVCHNEYKNRDSLRRHMQKLHGAKLIKSPIEPKELTVQNKFECQVCHNKYKIRDSLRRHIVRHHGGKLPKSPIEPQELAVKKYVIYGCRECSVDCKTSEEFMEHCHKLHENSTEKLYYRCKLCAGNFVHISEFITHVSSRHKTLYSPQLTNVSKKEFGCQVCHNKYKNSDSLRRHMQRLHRAKLPKSPIEPKELAVKKYVIYGCRECSVVVKTAQEFIEHCHKLHENSIEKLYYRCKLCARDFANLPQFTAHVSKRHNAIRSPHLTNVSKKEFECQVCHNKYKLRDSLRRHIRNHHGQQLPKSPIEPKELAVKKYVIYGCRECSVDCKTTEEFMKHCQKLHENSIEKLYYRCKLCAGDFANLPQFTAHVSKRHAPHLTNVSNEKFKCHVCHNEYKIRDSLRRHIVRNHGGKLPKSPIEPKELAVKKYVIYGCQECSVDVKTAEEIMVHCHKLHEHSTEKLYYRCKLCAGDFPNLAQFTAHVSKRHKAIYSPHLANVSKKEFKCQVCHNEYKTRDSFRCHMRKHPGAQLPKSGAWPQPCKYCSFPLESYKDKLTHLNQEHSDLKIFTCYKCDKTFFQELNLKQHIGIHDKVKKHMCQYCGRSFACSSNLNVHIRIHTGEKPFKCDKCDRCFAQWTALYAHKLNHVKEKNFECKECHKRFLKPGTLRAHMATHTAGPKCPCHLCPKQLKSYKLLRRHLSIHSGEKYCVCKVCGKGFNSRNNLRQHERTHGEKRHICTICNKRFSQAHCLRSHNAKFHIDEPS